MIRQGLKRLIWLMAGGALVYGWLVFASQPGVPTTVAHASQQASVIQDATASAPVLQYQGRLLDPTTGQPKPDGVYPMAFRLYAAATGGSPLWSETKSMTVAKGLFATLLGNTTPLDLTQFDGRNLYLGVSVGADPEAVPRQRIAYVAYAIHAENATTAASAASAGNADTVDGMDSTAFAPASHTHDGAAIVSGTVGEPFIDPAIARDAEVMPDVLAGDGAGSTLDADLLDGQDSTAFAAAAHTHAEFSRLPIAFAHINADGSVAAGTPNVTSSWDAGLLRYLVTIAGEDYFWLNYVANVTTVCDSTFARTSSVGGSLLVIIQNNSGTNVQCNFQVVVFKP